MAKGGEMQTLLELCHFMSRTRQVYATGIVVSIDVAPPLQANQTPN